MTVNTKKIYKQFDEIRELCYMPEWDRDSKKDFFTIQGKKEIRVHYTEDGIEKIVWSSDGTPANIGNGTIKKDIDGMVKNEIIRMKARKERSNQAFDKAIEFAKEHGLISGNEIEINYTEPEELKKDGYKKWIYWNEEKKCYAEFRGGTWNDDFKTDGYAINLDADTIENTEKRIIQEYGRLPEKYIKIVKKYIADFENKTIWVVNPYGWYK